MLFLALTSARPAAPAATEQEIVAARDPEDRSGCFEFASVDLDGDGTQEVLVLARDPRWCGTGGCTVMIFARSGKTLVERSFIPLVGRISVGLHRTRRWSDLVVENRYGSWLLVFDGTSYPVNPTIAPARKLSGTVAAGARLSWAKASAYR